MWAAEGMVNVDFNAKQVDVVRPSAAVRDGGFVATDVPPADRAALKERFFTEILPIERVAVPEANAIACEHDDFLEAVRTGRAPLVPASAGAAAVELAARVLDALACVQLGGSRTATAAFRTIPFSTRRKTG